MSEVCRDTVWQAFGNGHGQSVPCGRKGKVYVDGKWYCGIHDPAAVEKRRKKSEARYAEQTAKWRADNERQRFDCEAGDVCRELGFTPAALRDEVARLNRAMSIATIALRYYSETAIGARAADALEKIEAKS